MHHKKSNLNRVRFIHQKYFIKKDGLQNPLSKRLFSTGLMHFLKDQFLKADQLFKADQFFKADHMIKKVFRNSEILHFLRVKFEFHHII